jgi:hypothetical protein
MESSFSMMCSAGDVEGVSLKWIPYTAMIMLPLQVEEKDLAYLTEVLDWRRAPHHTRQIRIEHIWYSIYYVCLSESFDSS